MSYKTHYKAFHSEIEPEFSPSLSFELPNSTHAVRKELLTYTTIGGSYLTPSSSKSTELEIPRIAGGWLDGSSSYLRFKLDVVGTDATYSTNGGAWQENVEITGYDGQRIDDIRYAQPLYSAIQDYTIKEEDLSGTLQVTNGTGTDDERRLMGANGKWICMPINSTFFRTSGNLVPIAFLGPLKIKIDLANASKYLKTSDGSPATYAIRDLSIVCEVLYFSPEVEAAAELAWRENRMYMSAPTWGSFPVASVSLRDHFTVPHGITSLKGVIMIIQDEFIQDNFAFDSLATREFGIKELQMQIGDRVFHRIYGDNDAELMKTIQRGFHHAANGGIVTKKNFTADHGKFMYYQNTSLDESAEAFIAGDKQRAPININVEFTGPLASGRPRQIVIYYLYDRFISVSPAGIKEWK